MLLLSTAVSREGKCRKLISCDWASVFSVIAVKRMVSFRKNYSNNQIHEEEDEFNVVKY